ncbi:DUF502 domain-containing protein [Marichromatium sp. AB32]|uniref:DUF502 domain-containing protein n=1 Tax=Marichromatium sp. AB32 TaxID=2483363 RepID=UPI000F3DE8AC|nr:DUF502 domain-containing protein [Marichromatium sp. AB32]RNE94530.1 DUF502 domain-containing protein [Marichromatium sp. AB32]
MSRKNLFERLRNWFLQGLALLAPLVITIAFLVWLGRSVELFMGDLVRVLMPAGWYLPGMGLVAGVALTVVAGLIANLFLVRWLLRLAERVLDRIPLVKSLFQGIKDVSRFFAKDGDEGLGRPVAVDIQGMLLVGFVMQERVVLPGADDGDDRVAVFLPMSYQLGGFTVYLERDRIGQLDVGADCAMRAVLTGGSLGGDAGLGR